MVRDSGLLILGHPVGPSIIYWQGTSTAEACMVNVVRRPCSGGNLPDCSAIIIIFQFIESILLLYSDTETYNRVAQNSKPLPNDKKSY